MDAPDRRYDRARFGPMRSLSAAAIRKLVAAGLINPTLGQRKQHRFTFEELCILRTAATLLRAKVPMRRVLAALSLLQGVRPPARPLTALKISAMGSHIVVRDGNSLRTVEGGQLMLDFDGWTPGEVHPIAKPVDVDRKRDTSEDRSADEWFTLGEALESSDPDAAESAYRRAVACDACCVMAWLNLGALLGDRERWGDAAALYAKAIRHCPTEPSLHFSLGVAQEKLTRPGKALRSYERCLKCQPDYADAHLNVSRLLETLGDKQGAIRHLSAYRRATRAGR